MGPEAGRRDRAQARARRGRRPRGRARPARRRVRRRARVGRGRRARGFIDELVEPRDTRRRLAGALAALSRLRRRPATAVGTSRYDHLRRSRRLLHRRPRAGSSRAGRTRWRARSAATLATRTWRGWARPARTSRASSSTRALALEPDLVTLVCGANDVLARRAPRPRAYAQRLSRMFERLRREAPAGRDRDSDLPGHLAVPRPAPALARAGRAGDAAVQRRAAGRWPSATASRCSTASTIRRRRSRDLRRRRLPPLRGGPPPRGDGVPAALRGRLRTAGARPRRSA